MVELEMLHSCRPTVDTELRQYPKWILQEIYELNFPSYSSFTQRIQRKNGNNRKLKIIVVSQLNEPYRRFLI